MMLVATIYVPDSDDVNPNTIASLIEEHVDDSEVTIWENYGDFEQDRRDGMISPSLYDYE